MSWWSVACGNGGSAGNGSGDVGGGGDARVGRWKEGIKGGVYIIYNIGGAGCAPDGHTHDRLRV